MNWRVFVLGLIVVGLVLFFWYRQGISEPKARAFADRQLADYCKTENIAAERFGAPKVTADKKGGWIFEYETSREPKHYVYVEVSRRGGLESSPLEK